MTPPNAKQPRIRKRRDDRIGQSICWICGKTALPGSAIVREFGAGGRVHKQCFADEQTRHHVTNVKQEPVTPTNKV